MISNIRNSVFCLSIFLAAQANGQSGYHLAKTFPVSGDGKWDYIAVCPATNSIYVSHGTQVNVIDRNTGNPIAVIPNTTGVHGIEFIPQLNKGFITDGKLNAVTVFDLKTNKEITQIKTGENPDGIMYEPYSKMIITGDGHSKQLSVIDPNANTVKHVVPLDGKPEAAVSDDAGHLFVNLEDKSEIAVVNTKNFTVEKRWKLSKGAEPAGLAIDNKTHRLFAGCGNKILEVVNAENGKTISTTAIGDHCDGVVFDPETKMIFAANGDGTLTVIKEMTADKYTAQQVSTQKGARTLALDPETHNIYLPTADFVKDGSARPAPAPGTFRVLVVSKQ